MAPPSEDHDMNSKLWFCDAVHYICVNLCRNLLIDTKVSHPQDDHEDMEQKIINEGTNSCPEKCGIFN